MTDINNENLSISRAVGAGSKSSNHKDDVEIIQQLLNRHIEELKSKHKPLSVTGICDKQMVKVIKDFQKQIVKLKRPDGRVDPGGKTLRFLNKPSSSSPDISTETKSKPISSTAIGTFSEFIDSLELRHFSANEISKGFNNKINYKSKHADVPKAVGRNGEPPLEIWHNIAPTVIVLDEIREQLGSSVRLTNTFRSAEYNEANYIRSKGKKVDAARVKGKSLSFNDAKSGVGKLSQHMIFRAIDFKVDRSELKEAYRIAESLRGEKFSLAVPLKMANPMVKKMKYVGGKVVPFYPDALKMKGDSFIFHGGMHLYKSFIHIDCRGKDDEWK